MSQTDISAVVTQFYFPIFMLCDGLFNSVSASSDSCQVVFFLVFHGNRLKREARDSSLQAQVSLVQEGDLWVWSADQL